MCIDKPLKAFLKNCRESYPLSVFSELGEPEKFFKPSAPSGQYIID